MPAASIALLCLVQGAAPLAEERVSLARGAALERRADFDGGLHLWAVGEGDLVLRVVREDGEALEDDDSGGRPTPFLALEVRAGERLAVTVRAKEDGAAGEDELVWVRSPESEASRAAAVALRAALEEARALAGAARTEEARARLAAGFEELRADKRLAASAAAELGPELAQLAFDLGALELSRDLLLLCRARRERTLPPDHIDRLAVLANLAIPLRGLGELAAARELQEQVLAGYERTLAAEAPELLAARHNLGVTLFAYGDVAGARRMQEEVLEVLERALPEDDPTRTTVTANHALILGTHGDWQGARRILEELHALLEKVRAPDDPELRAVRANLAIARKELGLYAEARALEEELVTALELLLPPAHPELRAARLNLAKTLGRVGERAAAVRIEEDLLLLLERELPPEHPDLLRARTNLAGDRLELGDAPAAARLLEEGLAAAASSLPRDGQDVALALATLCLARLELGDGEGARALFLELIATERAHSLAAATRSPREAHYVTGWVPLWLSVALGWEEPAAEPLRVPLFELVETRRAAASDLPRAAGLVAADPVLAERARDAASARSRLNDLVATHAASEAERAAALSATLRERDRAEAAIQAALAERGLALEPLDAKALAARLPERSAAVGYLRVKGAALREGKRELVVGDSRLLAHVLRRDGRLARVDLGPAAELEELVESWRAALGAPLSARGERGAQPGASSGSRADEARLGELLRARLLDPVLAVAGEDVRQLLVCPDDLLYLVPLDALPLAKRAGVSDERVGDRLRIAHLTSFAHLGRPPTFDPANRLLVALGGIDYGAPGADAARLAFATPPVEALSRSGGTSFRPLPGSMRELSSIEEAFRHAFFATTLVLEGDRATKAAFAAEAPRARYLHLATHGWFAGEGARSVLEPRASEGRILGPSAFDETVAGFAPWTLCGLALAGANRGADSLGHVPGILSAEELTALDLSACELAVLSACETNVGLRRAGAGIRSLQSALHAAGARRTITSLWKVDDDATRELMARFYLDYWFKQFSPDEALWSAKRALRELGSPLRDWGAWVLTGEPQ